MKHTVHALILVTLSLVSCNNTSTTSSTNTNEKNVESIKKPYVTATINGVAWASVPDEILAKHSSFDDKLQIFTLDKKGKMNFLITLANFGKTKVGKYSSVKEGAGGFGISLLDEDKNDNIENDYDNFRQGIINDCIIVTDIQETKEGAVVTGTFASPMTVSNNYDANKEKGITVSNGKFSVLVKQ